MDMKSLFKEVMALNLMDDNEKKEAAAKSFFERLNSMELPEHFNWAEEIFEEFHVKERGDYPAFIWADIASRECQKFTYSEFAGRGNQCLN